MAYSDFLALWGSLAPYQLNVLVAGTDGIQKLLAIDEFKDAQAGLNFQGTGKLCTPLGATLVHVPGMAAGKIIALDKSCALEMVQSGDICVDSGKLIDRQLDEISISATAGFARIFSGAAQGVRLYHRVREGKGRAAANWAAARPPFIGKEDGNGVGFDSGKNSLCPVQRGRRPTKPAPSGKPCAPPCAASAPGRWQAWRGEDLSQAAQALWGGAPGGAGGGQAFYQLLLTEEAVTPASITAGDLRLAGGSRSEKAAQLVAEKRRAASPALVETDFAFCNIRKGEEDGSAQ